MKIRTKIFLVLIIVSLIPLIGFELAIYLSDGIVSSWISSFFIWNIISVVIVTISAIYLTRLILKPLFEIDNAMSMIAEGKYDFKIDKKIIARNDKLGYLAKSVEFMKAMIRESDSLFRRYNVELEDKVIEKTTNLTRANKKIKRYVGKLERANKLKDLFSDIMHHDLKNPLTVMKSLTEVNIMKKNGDPKYLKMMDENITRMQSIIGFASNYAKIMNNAKMPVENLDLRDIIKESVKEVKTRCEGAGIKLINRVLKKSPIVANEMLSEVFQNLLTNAIKYAKKGKKIIIDLQETDLFYYIKVIDFGDGVPDKYKTIIFSRFERSDNTKGIEGSGIGLGIVKKIVKLHKGSVWVEDNIKKGAVFIVKLPKNLSKIN